MMEGRHLKKAFSCELVGEDLEDHRQGLNHKKPSKDGQDEDQPPGEAQPEDESAQSHGPHVPQKGPGWIGIDPQEPGHCPGRNEGKGYQIVLPPKERDQG